MRRSLPGLILAFITATAVWLSAGFTGLAYVLAFAAAAVPGMPLGFALLGRRHPAAWIAGPLLGYGLTQLMLWAVIAAGIPSIPAFAAAWCLLVGAGVAAGRALGGQPLLPAPAWTARDLRALLVVLLLVPVLMGATYRNLGRADATGSRYYRAYFTADFVWHCALAYELGKFSLPPTNPYLAPEPMNYYWTYFLLPAVVGRYAPLVYGSDDVEPLLKTNAILAGLLMMAALFVLVRTATAGALPAVAAVALAVTAASAEGLYSIVDLVARGRPLAVLLDTNIDAVSNWSFGGLRIDNIPRSLWYTPQHTTSVALGLVALYAAVVAGAGARIGAIAAAGLALGLSTTMNPLLGSVCSLMYGVCVAADVLRSRAGVAALVRHALAAVFVVAAIGWGMASRVMDGAGSALDVGFEGFSRNRPILTLLLSLGPVLVPAVAGVFRPKGEAAFRAVTLGVAGIAVGLFLLYFVRISEASWVGFRAGQILLISIPVLLARTIEWLPTSGRALLVAAVVIVGLPTTVIDTYNAQDIGNRRPGPGFRWTLHTTVAQQAAFAWLRANTRPEDIVQMEPIVRAREHWTLIPSFAGRRMAAGQPISLMPLPIYQERSGQVRTIFATTDAEEAAARSRTLGIDYLYVDGDDARAYPAGTEKFERHPERFERVYTSRDVRIYRLK
jgi:hypothetical protein